MGHNYTKYSKNSENRGKRRTTAIDEAAQAEIEVEVIPKLGVVTDCTKLNVREEPNKESDVLCEILLGSEVSIDETESTDDFYKVCTEAGVEGFCMKQYINTKL